MPSLSFAERCYALVRTVPKGYITTYAEVAHALRTKAYRAVGNCLNKNPYAPEVPCHRVVASSGQIGGFAWGAKAKMKLLEAEGILVRKGRIVDFEMKLFRLSAGKQTALQSARHSKKQRTRQEKRKAKRP